MRSPFALFGRRWRLAGILVVASLLQACAGPRYEAVSDYDDSYDFSAVRAVHILPFDRTAPAEHFISDMQIERINTALADELRARGYRVEETRDAADIYLAWHLVTREKTDIRAYNTFSAYNCWRCGPPVSDVSVRQYTQGTFIVDLIDPLRNRSVWRSTISSQLSDQPDPQTAASNRSAAARAILAPFPPDAE